MIPRYLMSNNGVRIVSSRNQRTGEKTVYVPVSAPRPNWRRRLGLGLIGFAVGCVITVAGISAFKGGFHG